MPMTQSQDKASRFGDVKTVCNVFLHAAEQNRDDRKANGSVVDLPDEGHLLITGDMHDNGVNFEKALRLANLANMPGNHLILHELIHGEKLINGMDLSYRTSVQAAAMQIRFPGRVHVLLSNHELAQVNGEDITKHGVSSIEAFYGGLEYVFGEDADEVHDAFAEWVRSLPLAVRCANGVFVAHSLPSSRKRSVFDPMVLTRKLTEADMSSPDGSAYLMVWGRQIGQEWADDLATLWDTHLFVLGHQHADMGYEFQGETVMILASDHDHGVALPINLTQAYTRAQLADEILPFAAMPGLR